MKLLIVKVSALGDVVHALPVLAYLKSVEPALEIDWLVEESFAPLLEGHPLIRNVVKLRTKAWRRQGLWRGALQAIDAGIELRRERYEVVLDLQGNSKSGLFTLLAGAPLRFGFDRTGTREWPNRMATNRKVPLSEVDHYISDRSLAVARGAFPGGESPPSAGPLPVDPQVRQLVREKMEGLAPGDGPVAVLHYGTTWTTKLWSLDLWKELTVALDERGARLLLTWGNDAELTAAKKTAEASGGVAKVWPRGTLQELVALLDSADLVIGGDTGPIHIAAAVGTPTVSLYRVTDALRNGPRGERHIRLQAPLACSPCLRKECPRDGECANSITVAEVLQAAGRLLWGCS